MKKRVKRHAVTQPLDQSYRLIPLTQGQNAMVDVEDFSWLSQWNWFAMYSPYTKSFYALRCQNRKAIHMHSFILSCEQSDHKNHDTLDNRRVNIRPCNRIQNLQNRRKFIGGVSRFKGVTREARGRSRWRARLTVADKRIDLGRFLTEYEAARAYNIAAKSHYGEFAHLNVL